MDGFQKMKLIGFRLPRSQIRISTEFNSTVIHTLVPAVAWELQSQFAPGYMHFNIIF